MASILSHAVAGMAVGAWLGPESPPRRFWIIAAICGAIPDIDVVGWPLHIPNSSLIGHRALTHSITAAILFGGIAAWITLRKSNWSVSGIRLWIVFALATLTHSLLDAMTTYSVGVEFFAPFSQHRYRFHWQPLTDVLDGLARAIFNEFIWILLPASVLAVSGWAVRRKKLPNSG